MSRNSKSQLTRSIIETALEEVSKRVRQSGNFASSCKFPIELIVSGGTISVLQGVRVATEDIDYYCQNNRIMNTIEDFAKIVANHMSLQDNFMNTGLRFFIESNRYKPAVERSISQNQVLFMNDVFKIYEADYGYQLMSKLHRMSDDLTRGREFKKYDPLDAAHCLHKLIRSFGWNPSLEELNALYPLNEPVEKAVFEHVAAVYRGKFGYVPFVV
ncbi:hypothetical protein M413DRAFT_30138 [Hebeloma cylindrosporum]|uniref:DUF7582 domain-containing protein n=1 Tax=Hebeloma cylindrosporum TaxID=76867 RepID=A0A0C3BPS5_HEBCY|nr:hypothetical protein M413DRAFT_30138 [Hebeloma cylindrosporum h7]